MKTIVVGYDGTEAAVRALDRAADLGEALGARLVVTSVAPVLVPASHAMGAIDPTDEPGDMEPLLAEARDRLGTRNVAADYQPALGDPADAIVEVADEVRADLVVVGTRDPGFLQRVLGQSVSGSVVRHASCDVLVVR